MPKYYFTPSGNRQIAVALSNKQHEDFKFQHDHKSEVPDDIIFIPYLDNDNDTPNEIYGKTKYLAMLIGGSFNIASHEKAIAAELTLDWMIDWEKEQRVNIDHPELILPENPFQTLCEIYNADKAKQIRERNFIDYAIYLSKYDRFIRSLLLLSSQKYSFISLYSILDTIETKLRFPKIDDRKLAKSTRNKKKTYLLQKSNITERQIDAFTGTANNFGLLGLQSRHGDLDWELPQNTINLEESTKLILKLTYYTIYHHIDIEENTQSNS
ncbi:hypothetical protein IWX76_001310 [Pedobacter sp. CAN_A7]|uniref:hypothetical protein n=1 Tax=Pedobacter sp. CAN_A7 TaxID=2787722 RepID=UPI0018CBA3DE